MNKVYFSVLAGAHVAIPMVTCVVISRLLAGRTISLNFNIPHSLSFKEAALYGVPAASFIVAKKIVSSVLYALLLRNDVRQLAAFRTHSFANAPKSNGVYQIKSIEDDEFGMEFAEGIKTSFIQIFSNSVALVALVAAYKFNHFKRA